MYSTSSDTSQVSVWHDTEWVRRGEALTFHTCFSLLASVHVYPTSLCAISVSWWMKSDRSQVQGNRSAEMFARGGLFASTYNARNTNFGNKFQPLNRLYSQLTVSDFLINPHSRHHITWFRHSKKTQNGPRTSVHRSLVFAHQSQISIKVFIKAFAHHRPFAATKSGSYVGAINFGKKNETPVRCKNIYQNSSLQVSPG